MTPAHCIERKIYNLFNIVKDQYLMFFPIYNMYKKQYARHSDNRYVISAFIQIIRSILAYFFLHCRKEVLGK